MLSSLLITHGPRKKHSKKAVIPAYIVRNVIYLNILKADMDVCSGYKK